MPPLACRTMPCAIVGTGEPNIELQSKRGVVMCSAARFVCHELRGMRKAR